MPLETQTDNHAVSDHLISYPHSFVKATGNVASAIFLGQLLTLSKNATESDGWISKSMTEWEALTGLRRNEQETARKKLCAINLLEEEVRGMPATLCYRLNHDELVRLLPEANQYAETGKLVSNLVCSQDGGNKNVVESAVNQFAENNNPLAADSSKAATHPQAEQPKSNQRTFEANVRAAFDRLEKKIDGVKNQAAQLSNSGIEESKSLDQVKLMLLGLLVMVFVILMLCIAIWWYQPDYQNYISPQQSVPTNSATHNMK